MRLHATYCLACLDDVGDVDVKILFRILDNVKNLGIM